jgi:hypothetical protein
MAVAERTSGSRGTLASAARALTIGLGMLGSAATIEWIWGLAPRAGQRHDFFFQSDDLYEVDCRRDAGASLMGAPPF